MSQPTTSPKRTQRDASLRLGLACNQHCVFCDLHTTRRDEPLQPPLLQTLESMLEQGLANLRLTGGEPTLSPELLPALRWCQAHGVAVTLQSNGLLLAGEKARKTIWDLGVRDVVIHLPAADPLAYAALTRDPQGWPLLIKALQGLEADGFLLKLAVPLLEGNLHSLQGLGTFVAQHAPGVRRVEIVGYHAHPPLAPVDQQPHPFEVVALLRNLTLELAALDVTLVPPRLGLLPACWLRDWPQGPAWILRGTQGLAQPLPPGCAGCALQGECPGPQPELLEHFAELTVQPLLGRSQLRQIQGLQARSQPEENHTRRITQTDDQGHEIVREVLLRIVQQCNERCQFCWVDFEAPALSDQRIIEELTALAGLQPPPIVSFTGGEPTLHPRLVEWVAMARQMGASHVQLQTNATRVDGPLALALKQAGLNLCLVGLHGHTPELYGKITGAPQLFHRAVQGVEALLAAGVDVHLNLVISRDNAPHLVDIVEFFAKSWPGLARPLLVVAVASDIAGGALDPTILPKLSEIAEPLRQALERCLTLGLPFAGLNHPCGVPPCLLGGDPRFFHDAARWQIGQSNQVDIHAGKTAACANCVFDNVCPGLRPEYVARYGSGELQPIAITQQRPAIAQVCIQGLGRMGQRWLQLLQGQPELSLQLQSRRENLNDIKGIAEFTRRDSRQPVDLWVLAEETERHAGEVLALLGQWAEMPGPMPGLMVEKPLTDDALQAQALVDAAQAAGVPLWVHHTQAVDPALLCLIDAIDAGRIGPVKAVTLRRQEPVQGLVIADNWQLWRDHLVHEASVVDSLIGPGELSACEVADFQVFAPGERGLTGGVAGEIHAVWQGIWRGVPVELQATLGPQTSFSRLIEVRGQDGVLQLLQTPGQRRLTLRRDRVSELPLPPGDGLHAAMLALVKWLQFRNRPEISMDRQTVRVLQRLDAARAPAVLRASEAWLQALVLKRRLSMDILKI